LKVFLLAKFFGEQADISKAKNKKQKMRKIKKAYLSAKNGFTLIELLIVVAMIAILAGIILASMINARTQAANSKFKSYAASMKPALVLACGSGSATQNLSAAGFSIDPNMASTINSLTSYNCISDSGIIITPNTSGGVSGASCSNITVNQSKITLGASCF
jgi:prepilin-type N-terminal cleavage/methylation domain-containing protein